MKSILFVALLVSGTLLNAQKTNSWKISAGFNIVDIRTPDNFESVLKDYSGAQDWNLVPYPSKLTVERSLNKNFSMQLGLSLNKIEKGFGWEENDPLTDDKFFAVDAKAKYDLNNLVGETAWFDPYVALGIGYSKIGANGDFKVNGSYGANFWVFENVGLNLESSYNHAFNDNNTDYFQHSAGIVYRFDGTKKIKDSDGDGINDDEDKCPYEFGVPSLQGCPEPVRPIETDSDEDGILDKDDRCPNEKGFIENQGCPWPDTDGDGILDKDDKCPNEKGVASNDGCPVEEVKTTPVVDNTALLNELAGIVVYFDFDKDNIKSSETSKLDRMASIINQLGSSYTYDIQGNTDEIGAKNYNYDLSQKRANVVIDYLISKGISKSAFSSDALGETNTVSDSNALNRRVEIKIK